MFVIIPVRRFIRVFPLMVLSNVAFFAGAIPAKAIRALFTAPKTLAAFDLLAIPAVLIGGFVIFALGRQLTKKRVEDDSYNPLCRVGVMAWVMFLLGFASLAGGAFIGGVGAMDGWPQNPAYAQNNAQPVRETIVQTNASPPEHASATRQGTRYSAPPPEHATKHGTIYFAPSTSTAPAPVSANAATNAQPFYH